MRIDADKCIGCKTCIDYCNPGAIYMEDGVAVVDPDICVECWVCWRNKVCPVDCFEPTPLEGEGDMMKHILSDPTETSAGTGVPGRGTEEAKTNDVTGRFPPDVYGICLDMGRPGVGVYMRDVEKVAMAVASVGGRFAPPHETPLSTVMTDFKTGKVREDMLDIHFMSIIVEATCKRDEMPAMLDALLKVEKEIDSVFSLGIVSMCSDDDPDDAKLFELLDSRDIPRPFRAKVNVGLGRPLFTA